MERNYSGLVHGVDPTLRDLESVLGVQALADSAVRQVSERRSATLVETVSR